MTVVLDTNIVASATYWRGKPAHCLEAWVNGTSIPHLTQSELEFILNDTTPIVGGNIYENQWQP
ncbi:MAG: hypothetical protein HY298_22005 [Verrucomicrobia bacterium]|nr:hypothetical protein [Verrucomicrobiota bacterium]